jgi:hypothetical protein
VDKNEVLAKVNPSGSLESILNYGELIYSNI